MPRLGGVIDGVEYHTFYLVADEDLWGFPDGDFGDDISPHTLVVPMGNSVCVSTGIAMGQVNLTVEVLDAAPGAIDDRREWQAVSEVSFEARTSGARIAFMAEVPEPPFDSFHLSTGTGWYRVRAHAVGRSLDFDAVVTENPREEHLLQLWRTDGFAPARHDRIDDQWANQKAPTEVPSWDELADLIAGLEPDGQRRVAHWAASRACELAGATALDWGPAIDALGQGRGLPAPFDDPEGAWARLYGRRQIVTVLFDGVDQLVASYPPDAALAAVLFAADPNPTAASVNAILAAATAHQDPGEFVAAVLHEFGLS